MISEMCMTLWNSVQQALNMEQSNRFLSLFLSPSVAAGTSWSRYRWQWKGALLLRRDPGDTSQTCSLISLGFNHSLCWRAKYLLASSSSQAGTPSSYLLHSMGMETSIYTTFLFKSPFGFGFCLLWNSKDDSLKNVKFFVHTTESNVV